MSRPDPAEPGRKPRFLPVPGILGMGGRALLAVCLDETLDELVDVPCLG